MGTQPTITGSIYAPGASPPPAVPDGGPAGYDPRDPLPLSDQDTLALGGMIKRMEADGVPGERITNAVLAYKQQRSPGRAPGAPDAPDAGAQMREKALGDLVASMNNPSAMQMPTNPYGGASVATVNPERAMESIPPALQLPASMLTGPYIGSGQILAGAGQIANTPGAAGIAGNLLTGNIAAAVSDPGADDVAAGASKIVRGGMNIAAPTLPGAFVAAPLATAAGLAGGYLGSNVAGGVLGALGAPPGVRDLGSDIGGIVGGGLGAEHGPGIAQAGADAAWTAYGVARHPGQAIASRLAGKSQLDPTEASAVAYGQRNDLPMPTSVVSGSKLAQNVENIVQNLPLGSGVAKASRAAEHAAYVSQGEGEISNLGAPDSTAPAGLDVGEAIHAKLDANLAAHHAAGDALTGATAATPSASPLDVGEGLHGSANASEAAAGKQADDSYNILRSIEDQPQFAATVQTGTKLVDGGLNEAGDPVRKRVPVMESVQAPVDYRGFRKAVKPLLAEVTRPMPIAQRESSVGIQAMQNIVDSPDFVPASVADQDLGALKKIISESPQARSVRQAKFAADFLSKQVDAAVSRLGPDAVAALKQGRASTVAKYGAQQFKSDLGFSDVGTGQERPGEPVALADSLTRPADRGITKLRSVQQNAPEQIPALAQSFTQSVVDKVRSGDVAGAQALWDGQGAETRKILYPGAAKANSVDAYLAKADRLQSAKDALPKADSLVKRLTQPGDQNVKALQAVAEHAPEQMPALGQSVVQELLEQATAEAGAAKPGTALTKWNKIGDQTKKILFDDPYPHTGEGTGKAQNITDLLTLIKKSAENPNPSGSGSLMATWTALGFMVHNPVLGTAALIGVKPFARMIFNPAESALMRTALKMPAKSGAAGALIASKIVAAAGPDAVPISPSSPQGAIATAPANVPASGGGVSPNGQSTGAGGAGAQGAGVPGAVSPGGGTGASAARSASTRVEIPGTAGGYQAGYKLRELSDLQASHSGMNFQPNAKYTLSNDRDYGNAMNQGKILTGSSRSEFRPSLHVNDNPDAANGPIVTDSQGQVLGGNGRKMMLDRVYSSNPEGAQAYRDLVKAKAGQFGVDPADVDAMKQPVLTREIPDSELTAPGARQQAITDLNKVGTAALTPGERAISDSRRVSQGTLDDVASRLDAKGANATIADVTEGKGGGEILDKLVSDGVISPQERGAFQSPDGELTPAGKDRVSKLMIGRYFTDPAQLDSIAPSIRNKVERIAAPLAQAGGKADWSLTPHVQEALTILERAQKLGAKNVGDFINQEDLFGSSKYASKTVAIAKALQGMSSKELTAAARQYAQDAAYAAKGQTLMGDAPTPESSFRDAFGGGPETPPPANSLSPGDAALKARRDTQRGSISRKPVANALADEGSGGGGVANALAGVHEMARPRFVDPNQQSLFGADHEAERPWHAPTADSMLSTLRFELSSNKAAMAQIDKDLPPATAKAQALSESADYADMPKAAKATMDAAYMKSDRKRMAVRSEELQSKIDFLRASGDDPKLTNFAGDIQVGNSPRSRRLMANVATGMAQDYPALARDLAGTQKIKRLLIGEETLPDNFREKLDTAGGLAWPDGQIWLNNQAGWGTGEATKPLWEHWSVSRYQLTEADGQLATFIHEAGHQYHFQDESKIAEFGDNGDKLDALYDSAKKDNTLITKYAGTNVYEYFAESFTAAVKHPAQLKVRDPAMYTFMKDYLGDAGIAKLP